MKKIVVVCICINIIIFCSITYFLFLKPSDDTKKMIDVSHLDKKDVITKLSGYEVEFIEINSNLKKDVVVYTIPKCNELITENQKIKVYLSNGIIDIYYDDLINKHYEDYINYLNDLEENNNVNIIIEKQINDNFPDGVIISQSSNGIIKENDTFTIIVNYNNPLILIPDLTGKTETEVIYLFKKYNIILLFVYDELNGDNKVYKQSIQKNSLVLNGTILYVYISI